MAIGFLMESRKIAVLHNQEVCVAWEFVPCIRAQSASLAEFWKEPSNV